MYLIVLPGTTILPGMTLLLRIALVLVYPVLIASFIAFMYLIKLGAEAAYDQHGALMTFALGLGLFIFFLGIGFLFDSLKKRSEEPGE